MDGNNPNIHAHICTYTTDADYNVYTTGHIFFKDYTAIPK